MVKTTQQQDTKIGNNSLPESQNCSPGRTGRCTQQSSSSGKITEKGGVTRTQLRVLNVQIFKTRVPVPETVYINSSVDIIPFQEEMENNLRKIFPFIKTNNDYEQL